MIINGLDVMIRKKKCSGCKRLLPMQSFNLNWSSKDGRFHYCRECDRERRKKHRSLKPEHYKSKSREAVAKWRKKKISLEPENIRARSREASSRSYQKHKDKYRERIKRYQASNPEKAIARKRVYEAIKRGLLEKPENCPICGRDGQIVAHHPDYKKPLDVIWACKVCHHKIHNGG